ncbi:uncharacterized protein LOC142229524 [Haematobia irritans]|uniref:uncharacterized protein LOC142229524 n=1 Tax=Haematobia irritans TaxID=7368 RepID=UPI003F4FD523
MKLLKGFALICSVIFMTTRIVLALGQSWTYEMKSVETKTSNPDLVDFYNVHVVRVNRGIYALAGYIFYNVDVAEGDTNQVEVKAYRSENGIKEYKKIPFSVPRQHFYAFMNKFYKDAAMETLSKCSDLPVFEDKMTPPMEKKNFTMDNCIFSQEGLPQYLQEGFYKVDIIGYGDVEWLIQFTVEVMWTS